MKSLLNKCIKLVVALGVAGSLSGCYEIVIWDSARASGNINTEISEFINAETDEEKAKSLAAIQPITQHYNMIVSGWDSVVGYMSMYLSDAERVAIMSDYNRARDMLGLSLLISETSFETYCNGVANCKIEDYNTLLDRGRFVKSSLELAKPGLTERIALFKARYPRYNLRTALVENLKELLFDDAKFLQFLTDDEAALRFIAIDNEGRKISETRDQALNRLRPVDITILPALGS
jgi:hypothetical protein